MRRPLFAAGLALVAALTVGCGEADRRLPALDGGRFAPDRELLVGFADSAFGSPEVADLWADRATSAGADSIRVNLYWNIVAPSQPADARNAADPAYQWESIDTAVRTAESHGLSVLLTVLSAPAWAEGPDRPADLNEAPAGTWRPSPDAFGDFAHAVAARYSGSFPDVSGPESKLPQVDYFSAWNEPNIATYLTPQFEGGEPASAGIYVELLNAFYDEVKAVNPDAKVATAGTAPFGDPPGGSRTRPMEFWRAVLCVDGDGQQGDCPAHLAPRFDALAHHPIIFPPGPPEQSYEHPDDIGVADVGQLVALLRDAERLGTIEAADDGEPRDLIVPELWWDTDPPKPGAVPVLEHADYTARALHLLWEQGVEAVWFLQVRDTPVDLEEPLTEEFKAIRTYHTGIFTPEGEPKPAFDAVRFPFTVERGPEGGLLAWGQAPAAEGEVMISEEIDGEFVPVATVALDGSPLFEISIEPAGSGLFIAVQGEIESPPAEALQEGSALEEE